jgi:hypothetical protein
VPFGDTVTGPPETAFPVEKPVPVHEVAFVEDQDRFDDCPELIVVGLAVRLAVGAGFETVTVAFATGDVPPAPVQAIE